MRLVTILESTTERSASGMSVCDGDFWSWAAKVLITASGSGSTSTDARLSNTTTAKNREVCYLKGQHTFNFHYASQDTTLNPIKDVISCPETAHRNHSIMHRCWPGLFHKVYFRTTWWITSPPFVHRLGYKKTETLMPSFRDDCY